jgi:O-antigen ligase
MSALALYRSNSVTSLIVAVFWIAAMLWLTARRAPAASNLKLRLITGVLVASLCFVVLAVAMPQLNILNGGLAALGRSSDLTGRLELWQYGWGRFLQRPLLGYGFDSLASILSGTNTTVGQLHNGYLDLLLRGGLLGAAVFLLSFGQLVVRALATQVVAADGAWQLVTPVAILIHNVSESSIARPVHSLWLLFLLGATGAAFGAIRLPEHLEQATDGNSNHRSARAAPLPNLLS